MTRTITTTAELDALPVWAAVRGEDFTEWVRFPVKPDAPGDWVSEHGGRATSAQLEPRVYGLTVLHDPPAPAPAPSVVPEAAVEARAALLHHYLSDETDEDSLTGVARLAWEQVDDQRREFVRGIVRRFLVDDESSAPSATCDEVAR